MSGKMGSQFNFKKGDSGDFQQLVFCDNKEDIPLSGGFHTNWPAYLMSSGPTNPGLGILGNGTIGFRNGGWSVSIHIPFEHPVQSDVGFHWQTWVQCAKVVFGDKPLEMVILH